MISEEERFEISVNQEDVQNIINCYEKDIEYIKQLEQENQSLKDRIKKVDKFCKEQKQKMYKSRNKIAVFILSKIQELLKGDK